MLANAKTRKATKSNDRQSELLSAKKGHDDMLHIIEDYERERARMEALRYGPDLPDDDFEGFIEEELYELEVN